MDIALGIAVPLPLLPDPTPLTASYHKKPGIEQSRAAKPHAIRTSTRETFPLPQWKKPGWDQLLKVHHEVWRIKNREKRSQSTAISLGV